MNQLSMLRIKLSYLTILLIFCELANAQTDSLDEFALFYGDEEMVSIATGAEKPLYLAPSVATVITADDIRATGASNLEDVLETVPGLHVSLGPRYSSLFSVRGIHTSFNPHVLILINGYPITELFTGSRLPNFNIPVHNIKRIEVIRGPVSALFGADAFAGAINIITYETEGQNNSAGMALGSFDTREVWLQGQSQVGEWSFGFNLEWVKSDGDSARRVDTDLQTVFDSLFFTNASLAPGSVRTNYEVLNGQLQLRNEQWTITLNSWETKDTGIGVGIADALDATGNQQSAQHLFDIDYIFNIGDWNIQSSANYFNTKERSFYTLFPSGAVLPIGTDGNLDFIAPAGLVNFPDGLIGSPGGQNRSLAMESTGSYTGFSNHRIRLSVGYKHQEIKPVETKNFGPGVIDGSQVSVDGTLTDVSGTPFIFVPNKTREVHYLSLQDEWSFFRDWELTAGVRFDDYSDFGKTFNPRAALVWQTRYNLTSKLLYGSAFRAPSFSELFSINNPILLGNSSLDPEEVETWELSFDYRLTYDLRAQLNLYRYDAKGLIEFIPDGVSGSSTAQNALDLQGHGLELEAEWKPSDTLSLMGSYSLQHAENDNNGEEVADAPQQLFKFDLRWRMQGSWFFSTQFHHVANRPRLTSDIRPELDDYTLVNMNFYSEQWHPQYDISIAFRNVLDKDTYEPGSATVPIDHPLEGRSIRLTLDYRFEK